MARVIRGPGHRDPALVLADLEKAREEQLAEVREELVELAGAIAKRAVLGALEADPAVVRELATQALARVRRATRITVRAHPEDVASLDGLDAKVVGDDTLGRGDCVVESELGGVDGRIEARVDRLVEALKGAP